MKGVKLLSQVDIAKRARVSEVSIHNFISGKRFPSRKMAEDLEFATGIARESWMWPDRWFNPYIGGSSPLLSDPKDWAGKKEKPVTKRRR